MSTILAQEYPNIDDNELIRCCIEAGKVRGILVDFTSHVLHQFSEHSASIPAQVAFAATNRVAEAALSAELLCQKNRVRDAAILLLSIIELSLDLQFISADQSRAETWVEHSKQNVKPWRVADQFKELFPDKNEREARKTLYRIFSMVKHCNPAGGTLAFPISATSDGLSMDGSSTNSPWVRSHMFALGAYISETGKAASTIWASMGLNVGAFASDFDEGVKKLSKYNEDHIISVLKAQRDG